MVYYVLFGCGVSYKKINQGKELHFSGVVLS